MTDFVRSPKQIVFPLFFVIIVIFVVIYGLKNQPAVQIPTPKPPDWLADWIEAPKCLPPCWENLIPGGSKFMDATITITNRSDTEYVKQDIGPLSKNQKAVSWLFSNLEGAGEIYSDLSGDKIATIILHSNNKISIDNVLKRFPDPDRITISSCSSEAGPMCEGRLLYSKIGLAIKFSTNIVYENSDYTIFSIHVVPTFMVSEIMLFQPGDEGYIQSTKNKVSDNLEHVLEWQGYGKYTFSMR